MDILLMYKYIENQQGLYPIKYDKIIFWQFTGIIPLGMNRSVE